MVLPLLLSLLPINKQNKNCINLLINECLVIYIIYVLCILINKNI